MGVAARPLKDTVSPAGQLRRPRVRWSYWNGIGYRPLYPENITSYHEQVRRSGLSVPDLDVTFYGMTELRLDDPDGNRLWIGQSTSAREGTRVIPAT